MSNQSKLRVVTVMMYLDCIACVGGLFYLYQRTALHRWDNLAIAIPVLLSFVLMVLRSQLIVKSDKERNV
jgi:uncharacterized protein (DUF983 family)